MKALIIAREGRRAILLLPGGEMRTVRARDGWQTGMKVDAPLVSVHRKKKKRRSAGVWVPAMACAAVMLVVFAGIQRLGGDFVDRQHAPSPLSSGMPALTEKPTAAPTETPPPMPASTPQPTIRPEITAPPQPTAQQGKRCDECGQYGHDDDDCPNERCDECGQYGHDDDDCPNRKHHGSDHHDD